MCYVLSQNYQKTLKVLPISFSTKDIHENETQFIAHVCCKHDKGHKQE
jgi:hypothetical protein